MPPPIDTEEAARRLARVIVSDIQLYNGAQIAAGEDISPQIKEGMHHFVSRVAPALHDVFEKVLTERGLRGGVPFSASPQKAAAYVPKHTTPAEALTPLELPAARTISPPPAQVNRWDEGAEPERATPRVLSIPPIEPEPEVTAVPAPVEPTPERPTARSIPVKQDPVAPPPIPRAVTAAPRAIAPSPLTPIAPRPFASHSEVSHAEARSNSPVPQNLRPAHSQSPHPAPHPSPPQPVYPVAVAGLEQGSSPEGPVPNLKPPFPWVRVTLLVGAFAAAVAGLMVMVNR